MSKIKFKAEVNKLLDIVVNSLYSEKHIFLRELISNASDACDKLKYLCLINPEIAKPVGEMKITVIPDSVNNTLIIDDNGIGMNKDDLINHLGTIAKSGTADFVKNVSDNGQAFDLIGQFGVGFYSAFMVAAKVEVKTKKAGENQAFLWASDGEGSFDITETTMEHNGTEVKLYLKEDQKQFTDSIFLRHTIRTYSDHIGYPIILDLGAPGEEQINSSSAIWSKHKSEVTEKQYSDFYKHISKNFDEPWLTLHFKAEGNMEYSGLLYIPSTVPYDLFQPDQKKGLKLYVNKVFISDKVESLLPNYLRFVQGVIDSSDLPLNISREMLQQNALLEKIKTSTTTRILKELQNRSKNEEDYEKFWRNFGVAFKEGVYEDFSNRELVAGLSRFASTNNIDKLTSLDEYIARAKENQKAIYYITGENKNVLFNNPQLEIFKASEVEVLLLTDAIDEFWVQTLPSYKNFVIKHISQADVDMKINRDSNRAEDGNLENLIKFLTEEYKSEVATVNATEALTSSPASLRTENGQMSLHLERLMKSHHQQTNFASARILEINPYHKVIVKMSEDIANPQNKDLAKLILDLAKIAEGEPISDPAFFNAKVGELMALYQK